MGKGGMVRSLVFVALMAAGCGRRGEQPAACVPGAIVTCPCAGAPIGSQTCQSNGTFGACSCPTTAPALPVDPDKPPPVTAPPESPPAAATAPPTLSPIGRPSAPTRPVVAARAPSQQASAPWVPTMEHCADSVSCEECAHRSGCGWCAANRVCLPTIDCSGPINGSCGGNWYCRPGSCPSPQASVAEVPVDPCARNRDCRSCAIGEACAWCSGRAACRERGNVNAGACLTSWVVDENACQE